MDFNLKSMNRYFAFDDKYNLLLFEKMAFRSIDTQDTNFNKKILNIFDKSEYILIRNEFDTDFIKIKKPNLIKDIIQDYYDFYSNDNISSLEIKNKNFNNLHSKVINAIVEEYSSYRKEAVEKIFDLTEDKKFSDLHSNFKKLATNIVKLEIDEIISFFKEKNMIENFSLINNVPVITKVNNYNYDYLKRFFKFEANEKENRAYGSQQNRDDLFDIVINFYFSEYINQPIKYYNHSSFYSKYFSDINSIQKLTNKDLDNVVKYLNENDKKIYNENYIILELIKRKKYNYIFETSMTNKLTMLYNISKLDAFPFNYQKELDSFLENIFSNVNFNELNLALKNLNIIYSLSMNRDKKERIAIKEEAIYNISKVLKNNKLINLNNSEEYLFILIKNMLSYVEDQPFNDFLKGNEINDELNFESLNSKFAVFLTVLIGNDDLDLFRESIKELLANISSNTAAKQRDFYARFNSVAHRKNFNLTEKQKEIMKEKIKILFEEVSDSKLRDNSIEKMFEKTDFKFVSSSSSIVHWLLKQDYDTNYIFGLENLDVYPIILESGNIRNIVTSIILKLQLS
jgi:hypothetical protein